MLDEGYYEIHDGCCDVDVRRNDGECESYVCVCVCVSFVK